MRILFIGGTGNISAECADLLHKQGHDITILGRGRSPAPPEYRAIVAAGILVQVDDPFLPDIFVEPGLDDKQKKRKAETYVEATNAALRLCDE